MCVSADADIRVVPPDAIQAHAAKVCSLDLMSVSPEEVESVQVILKKGLVIDICHYLKMLAKSRFVSRNV